MTVPSDREVVIVLLRQPRDADRADDGAAGDPDRHDATVRGVLARVEPRVGVEVAAVGPERLAHEHRRVPEAQGHAVLALEPAVVVGRGAGQRRVEDPLRAEPDRDRHGEPALCRRRAEPDPERPRVVEREPVEDQFGLLGDEPFAQLAHGRSSTLIARRSSMAA